MQAGLILKKFGEEVRRQRKRRGLSQGGLAFEADLHRTYISSVERGERNVTLLNIHRIARALKVRPGELVEGSG
jgi:transcriptional regulator with XRE-family HTH domain